MWLLLNLCICGYLWRMQIFLYCSKDMHLIMESILFFFFVNTNTVKACFHKQIHRIGRSFVTAMAFSYLNFSNIWQNHIVIYHKTSFNDQLSAMNLTNPSSILLKVHYWNPLAKGFISQSLEVFSISISGRNNKKDLPRITKNY